MSSSPLLAEGTILSKKPLLDGEGKPFVLMEQIVGKHPSELTKENAAEMGRLLAQFHNLSGYLIEELGKNAKSK